MGFDSHFRKAGKAPQKLGLGFGCRFLLEPLFPPDAPGSRRSPFRGKGLYPPEPSLAPVFFFRVPQEPGKLESMALENPSKPNTQPLRCPSFTG